MDRLDGKVAMVTGGATGIGAAIVERLASDGARVACCYNKSYENAKRLADRLLAEGREILTVRMDLLDCSEIEAAVRSIKDHFGKSIDILVNNAGDVFGQAPADKMPVETWDSVIGINLRGTFLCCRYCLQDMKSSGGGRIINMSSISARSGGGPGGAHYAASKGGIEALTRALAKECGEYGITVNAISPGVIYTPMHQRTNTPEALENLRRLIPLKKLGVPEDVSAIVSFLCSEEAGYITGAVVHVNGGMRMD